MAFNINKKAEKQVAVNRPGARTPLRLGAVWTKQYTTASIIYLLKLSRILIVPILFALFF